MNAEQLQSPRGIRERVARQAQELVGADEVFFVKYARVDGVNHYTGFTGSLSSDAQRVFADLDGQPTLVDDIWQPTKVPREERNRFQHVGGNIRHIEQRQARIYKRMYGPLEITRSCRTRLYDGPRFLGYVGCLRRGDGARDFSREEIERLDRFADQLKGDILAADRLELPLSEPAYGVFGLDRCRLDWASSDVRPWFTTDRLAQIRHVLGREELPAYIVLDNQVLHFSELEGEAGPRIMVSLEHGEEPCVGPAADKSSTDEQFASVGMVSAALNRLPIAALVVSETLQVLHLNRRAEDLLETADKLSMRRGELVPGRASEANALREAVAEAVALADSPLELPVTPSQVVGVRRGARLSFDVLAVPLEARSPLNSPADRPAQALLLIYDPESRPRIDPVLVERLFELTRTEAIVAARLAEGHSIADIAKHRRCSTATVRTHVKHIFQKTHTSRQAELVQLILTSPAISFGG